MFDQSQLVAFTAVAAALVVMPGPNTVLILANGLAGGRRAGVATVLGVEAGTLFHSLAAGLGVSTLLATSPAAFGAVKYGGAAYLGDLGLRAWLNAPSRLPHQRGTSNVAWTRTFRHALLVSIFNPKAAVFFVALLPQFVDRTRGNVLAQFVALGAIVAVIGLLVGLALALVITREIVRTWLWSDRAGRWQNRVTGAVLFGLGVRVALTDGP